ncbi:hypothetical protein COCNU_scaffold010199G000010 [Cocos nucifera]|nr:hypothetical protein [Cocos nucifera]
MTASDEVSGIQAVEEERNSGANVEKTPTCGEPATTSPFLSLATKSTTTAANDGGGD